MNVRFKKKFRKQYYKLPKDRREKFDERLELFMEDSRHPLLKDHSLKGKYEGYRSINVTGDIRAVYRFISEDTILFVAIGSHSELYE